MPKGCPLRFQSCCARLETQWDPRPWSSALSLQAEGLPILFFSRRTLDKNKMGPAPLYLALTKAACVRSEICNEVGWCQPFDELRPAFARVRQTLRVLARDALTLWLRPFGVGHAAQHVNRVGVAVGIL